MRIKYADGSEVSEFDLECIATGLGFRSVAHMAQVLNGPESEKKKKKAA